MLILIPTDIVVAVALLSVLPQRLSLTASAHCRRYSSQVATIIKYGKVRPPAPRDLSQDAEAI